jgi:TDG/mug DNA glycosylase family protein
MGPTSPRPSRAELLAAAGRTIDDVIAPDLDILFVGINPGLWSGLTGFHFANPGNRFWRAIALAGLVDRVLDPSEQAQLLAQGIGITNLVRRTTASAAELSRAELRSGGRTLAATVERERPRDVAFLGISTYKVAFDAPAVEVGPRPDPLAGARAWVLPNPSGLNASWTLPRLADAYRALRD